MAIIGRSQAVVLDTQNLRGAPLPMLGGLRRRGFRVHISNVAFEELWAQAYREADPKLLTSRIPKIAPFIDQDEPVKTTAADLVTRLGGTVGGTLRAPVSPGLTTLAVAKMWRELADRKVHDSFIAQAGAEIAGRGAERETLWKLTIEEAAAIPGWNDINVPEGQLAKLVAYLLYQRFGRDIYLPGSIEERFNAYYLAGGLHAARSHRRIHGRLRKVDGNDVEDLSLLMHLAEGAFIGTDDKVFIEHVDSCGTFQAPWVRTLAELLESKRPQGKPWVESARRALARHRVRAAGPVTARTERSNTMRSQVGYAPRASEEDAVERTAARSRRT